jgi:hypothetical protein
MNLSDYLSQINNAFLVFSFGEGLVGERLDGFSFDEEGIRQRWQWHDNLAKNILEFLNGRFPGLGRRGCLAVCDVQMSWIREKIRATEGELSLYRSIVQKYLPT